MRYFYDALLLDGARSGVEVSVAEVAAELARRLGRHLTIVCRRGVPDASEWAKSASVKVAPAWAKGRLGRIAAEQFWLPKLGAHNRLLHGPAYVAPVRWPGPIVLTVYDVIALRRPQWTRPSNALHYRLVLPRSARRADAVITPSHTVADELCEATGITAAKVRVVPLGVRRIFRRPASQVEVADFRRRHHLDAPFLSVVGNIEPKKNIRAVVAAFERAASTIPHRLVIAFSKIWRAAADLRAIRNSPVRERIVLLRGLSDTDLRALYTASTAVIQWSLYEGFGLVPLEAMSCGAPVIISDGGALPETAGPAAVVVPLSRPDELTDAIVAVATDQKLRSSLAQRGQKWAEAFTWSAHAAALVETYKALA